MVYRQLSPQETEDLSSRILYEDNHLLVVNKRPGEIVQGDKTGDETLCDKYKAFIAWRDSKPGEVFLGIPHRLDRPVSGVTILSKTSKCLERMTAAFRDGTVHKTYWALVCAKPPKEEDLLENWLWKNEQQNRSYTCKEGKRRDAKLARLKYSMIAATDRYFLLEVDLLTGRHHQIRCQLSSIGCPIKGDLKYGAPRSNPDGGISLHSRKAVFPHPVRKDAEGKPLEMEITAPVPSSWKGIPTP